jgi:hypothetical protein
VALSQLQPVWLLAWPAARDPYRIRRGAARCRQRRGSRDEWRAALDPGGLSTATSTCGPPCAKEPYGSNRDPRCSMLCLKGSDDAGWPRRRWGLTAPKQHAPWLDSRDPLGSLGFEGIYLGRRRPARRGRRHGRHGSVGVAAVRGSAVGAPTLARMRANARACGCAWGRTYVGV